jgi:U3 small nucleolar RNA-associated protein 6
MAENVVIRLEEMLPEVVYFEQREVFNKKELTNIMAMRRKFEYGIASRQAKLEDFLSYIDHEIQLESQRRAKYEELNIKKSSSRDFVILQRIHSLFSRCVSKYSADISVWHKYIEFCINSGSSNQLTKILMRATKRHPRCATFRIIAANREVQHGSLIAARKLLMRAVRAKTDNRCLVWEQLFKLECVGIFKIATREVASSKSTESAEQSVPEEASTGTASCQPAIVVFKHAIQDLSEIGKVHQFKAFAKEAVSTLELSTLGYTKPLQLDQLIELVA